MRAEDKIIVRSRTSRRGFVGVFGLLLAAAALSSCVDDVLLDEETDEYRVEWNTLPANRQVWGNTINSFYVSPGGVIFLSNTWKEEPDGTGMILISRDNGITWEKGGRGLNSRRSVNGITSYEDGVLLVGMDGGGVFRSVDDGINWKQVNNHLTDLSVMDVIIDAEGIAYAGAGPSGIFFSSDRGDHWEECRLGNLNLYNSHMEFDPERNLIYAITYDEGLYCLSDTCSTWQHVPFPEEFRARYTSIDSRGYLYIAGTRVVIVNHPSETRYLDLTDLLGDEWIRGIHIDMDDNVYLMDNSGKWLLSVDGGNSWEEYCWSLGSDVRIESLFHTEGCVFINSRAYGRSLFRSCDSGETWQLVGRNNNHLRWPIVRDSGEILCHQVSSIISYVPGASLWNFKTALDHNCDFPYKHYGDMMIEHPEGFILKGLCGLSASYDDGSTWNTVFGGDTTVTYIDIDSDGTVYLATNHGLLRSQSDLSVFDLLIPGDQNPYTIESLPNGIVFLGNDDGLLRSYDYGANWESLIDTSGVVTVVADEGGNTYAGYKNVTVFSNDWGESWQEIKFEGQMESPQLILLSPGGRVIAHTNYRRIYCLEAGEREWTLVTPALPMRIDVYVGKDDFLYYHTDEMFKSSVPISEFQL